MKKPNDCSSAKGFVPSKDWVKDAYKELCKQYFAADKMPDADSGEIEFTRKPSKKAHGTATCSFKRQLSRSKLDGRMVRFEPRAGEFLVKGFIIGDLSINLSSFTDWSEKEAYEVLIHEMIHIWQYLNEIPTVWATSPHGRSFLIKSRQARADGWDIGIRGLSSTRPATMSPSERLKQKYHH